MVESDSEAEDRWDANPHPLLVRALQPLVRTLELLHPVRFEGLSHLPVGPALLVGNHGMLGYESLLFFERLFSHVGRVPLGLADRWFFKVPLMRDVLVRVGGMYGSARNGLRALRRGALVVCYPGGARETLKRERDKYRLQWQKSVGFVRLAREARVPIIPFAAAGVDDTYRVVGHLEGSGHLLMGHGKYDLPLVWGMGPLPKPVPFWFRFGEPVVVRPHESLETVHRHVWDRTQTMLDALVDEWTAANAHLRDPVPPSLTPRAA